MIIVFLLKLCIAFKVPDRAIVLRFFKYLLFMIGTAFNLPDLKSELYLPQSIIHGCYSFLDLNESPFKEFIVSPSCNMLYGSAVHRLVHEHHLNVNQPNAHLQNFQIIHNSDFDCHVVPFFSIKSTRESNFIQTIENLLLLWTTTCSVNFIESTKFPDNVQCLVAKGT